MENANALIVEDNEGIQELLEIMIGNSFKNLHITADPEEALLYAQESDLVITDHNLETHITGHDLALKLRELYLSNIYIISHSSDLPYDCDRKVYNNVVQKGTGYSNLLLAIRDFEDWYKR